MHPKSSALNHASSQAGSLLDWYWEFGRLRRGRYQVATQWLNELSDAAELLDQASAVSERTSGGIAVWGPSQAGKSTLLSQFVDSEAGSALDWAGDGSFRFINSAGAFEDTGSLNPYNQKSDASGCVTRFRLTETVEDPDHPVTVELGGLQAILHALAAGYADECDPRDPKTDEIPALTRDTFLNAIPDQGDAPIERSAFAFARDVALTIERLISDENDRFSLIDRAWESDLRFEWLRSAVSLDEVRRSAMRLLWDDRSGLTRLFSDLEAAKSRYDVKFGGVPIRCSLDVAALLLNIETFSVLNAVDGQADAGVGHQAIVDAVSAVKFERRADCVVIGHSGEPLFDDAYAFGLFQGLVWCIDVPLRADFIRDRSQSVAELLDRFDLYDLPGVARAESGVRDSLIRPDVETTDSAQLLAEVLKRGKTASIVTRFAVERRFDAALILVNTDSPPSKPQQLQSGVAAIWNGIDPGRKPDARSKAPTFLNLTFFGKSAEEWTRAKISPSGLKGIGKWQSGMPLLSNPDLVTLFFTDYPHLTSSRSQIEPEAIDKLLGRLEDDSWVKSNFPAGPSRESLTRALHDEDGGVSHMLSALNSQLSEPASRQFIDAALERGASALSRLTDLARPQLDGASERERAAIGALDHSIRMTLRTGGADAAEKTRRHIDEAFGVRANNLSRLPRNWGSKKTLREYLGTQISAWAEDSTVRQALTAVGVPEADQPALIAAFSDSIDQGRIVDWLSEFLPNAPTIQQSDTLRRKLAIAITNEMGGGRDAGTRRLYGGSADLKHCQKWFDDWREGVEDSDSPHFEMRLRPFLDHLSEIKDRLADHDWEPQPGDDVIESLWDRFTPSTISDRADA